jgi:hypothetical protein
MSVVSLIGIGETDSAFESRIALYEQARLHCCRNRRGDSHQSVEPYGAQPTRLPKRFPIRERMEWEGLCDKTSSPVFVEEATEVVVVTVDTYYF